MSSAMLWGGRMPEARERNCHALVQRNGAPGNSIATEVEPHLHDASGRSFNRWKCPLLGRLDGESLEIPAGPRAIGGGGEDRTVLIDDDPNPDFDVSADSAARI